MFGVETYNPKFFMDVYQICEKYEQHFKELIGKYISETWIVWDKNHNEWFRDCPIIFNINGIQLELCAYKLDQFAITFNEINLSEKLDWYGMDEFDLEWRRDAFAELLQIKNKLIKNIEIIEYNFSTEVIYSKNEPESIGYKASCWVLNGIGFELESSYFSIYNGLDENAITLFRDEGKDFRITKILP